jgi:hypothetical protein
LVKPMLAIPRLAILMLAIPKLVKPMLAIITRKI